MFVFYIAVIIYQEVFRHMPKQRRLDPEMKEEAVKLLKLKANKKTCAKSFN